MISTITIIKEIISSRLYSKARIFLTCMSMMLVTACTNNHPAQVEHREQLYYGRSGVVKLVTVFPGQSLADIAADHNVSVDTIAKANNIPDTAYPQPGQVIKVPIRNIVRYEDELYYEGSHSQGDEIEEIVILDNELGITNQRDTVRSPVDLGQVDVMKETIVPESESPNVSTDGNSGITVSQSTYSGNFRYATPLNSPDFIWPVEGKVLFRYGEHNGQFYEGMNIIAPLGTIIKAIGNGEVVYSGVEPKVYGKLVIIKHPNGYLSAYAHNDRVLVKKGEKVNKGTPIATVGKSGSVSTAQLHFSMRRGKTTINPEE